MKRVCVIGNGGGGKSTFADRLGKITHLPVIHMDKEFWNPDWTARFLDKETWHSHQKKLIQNEKWIMDGDYRTNIQTRLDQADTIIFFDVPRWQCIWRVIKRSLSKEKPFDKHEGMKNKVEFGFLVYLYNYPYKEIRSLLHGYKDKKIYAIKNDDESRKLLEQFSGGSL